MGGLIVQQQIHMIEEETTGEEGANNGQHGYEIAHRGPGVDVTEHEEGNGDAVGEEGHEVEAAQVMPDVGRVEGEPVRPTEHDLE